MKVETIAGGCSTQCKPVGFQFTTSVTNEYYLNGSFLISPGGIGMTAEKLNGKFLIGQSFRVRGCKECGNKFVYQCRECGSFVCYDGKQTKGAVCPVCGVTANVAEEKDERIVVSNPAPKLEIILAMDVSSSMDERTRTGTRLEEAKSSAIENFVRAFPDAKMALVAFGTQVREVLGFTEDERKVERAVGSLVTAGGTTSPFHFISEKYTRFLIPRQGVKRYIVVFTDGKWAGNTDGHLRSARKLRDAGVEIVTIGCAEADRNFLENIASPGAAVSVTGDDFGSAYATAASKIMQG